MPTATRSGPIASRHRRLTKTPLQSIKDATCQGVSGTWPINRAVKASRGFDNLGAACYYNSCLQSLLHLPKFMNWINEHNVTRGGIVENACATLFSVQIQDGPRVGQMAYYGSSRRRCLACAMKRLINLYWGNQSMATATGLPLSLHMTHDPATRPIRHFVTTVFGTGQQCPYQFFEHFLDALSRSTVNTAFPGNGWHQTFSALFATSIRETTTNEVCGHIQTLQSNPYIQFPAVTVLPYGESDSISKLIARAFEPQPVDTGLRLCDNVTSTPCGLTVRARDTQNQIEAAPEYIMIPIRLINNYPRREKKRGAAKLTAHYRKNFNPIKIPQQLDLTRYQVDTSVPLVYRLSSVVQHQGDVQSSDSAETYGHYITTVKGPEKSVCYTISDHQVNQRPHRALTQNPQMWPTYLPNQTFGESTNGSNFEAYQVYYIRVHKKIS